MFNFKFTITISNNVSFVVWLKPPASVVNQLHSGELAMREAYLACGVATMQRWSENGRGFAITGFPTPEFIPSQVSTLFVAYPSLLSMEIELVESSVPLIQANADTLNDIRGTINYQ